MELNERYARDLDKYLSSMEDKRFYNVNEAKNLILKDTPLALIDEYFYILKNYLPMVVYTHIDNKNGKIAGNQRSDYTQEFLDEGGFTAIYQKQVEREKKKDAYIELDIEQMSSTVDRNRNASREARISIGIALAAFLLSLYTILHANGVL